MEWNTLVAIAVDNVLTLGWQDNNFILGLSTIHTVHEASSFIPSMRKRPPETSINAKTVHKPFRELAQKELEIPSFIDDYNHNMNSVDLANQFRQAYDTQQIAY